MEIKTIDKIRYEQTVNGEPVIQLEVDGRWAEIMYGQKLLRYGAVFLGASFKDFVFIVPADPGDGRYDLMHQRGFTNDLRVVRLVQQFREDVNNGRFQVGPVKI